MANQETIQCVNCGKEITGDSSLGGYCVECSYERYERADGNPDIGD